MEKINSEWVCCPVVEIKLVTKYGRILFWCIILFIARNANEKL